MKQLLIFFFIPLFFACNSNKNAFDASGSFETDEVIVSAQLNGQLLSFNVQEGDSLLQGQVVGLIDSNLLSLQKAQVNATIKALAQKTVAVAPQVQLLENQLAVQQAQLNNLLHEKQRIENLYQDGAVTSKQVDDINTQADVAQKQINVTQQQIAVQKNNTATQNRTVLSEAGPLQKQVAQVDEQLSKAKIINPVKGTVITKYAEQGEVTAAGKPLYKIADLSEMTLRAYVTGAQLSEIKLGQHTKVLVDKGEKQYRNYEGVITWISDKAEFTPKTIQTKEERANLVYAIKIKVKNDGYLKIGMYGEVQLKNS